VYLVINKWNVIKKNINKKKKYKTAYPFAQKSSSSSFIQVPKSQTLSLIHKIKIKKGIKLIINFTSFYNINKVGIYISDHIASLYPRARDKAPMGHWLKFNVASIPQ
jgi:hypothetical protein